jgi:molecular chaperone DnaK
LVYQSEKALNELGDRVPANDRAAILSQIDAVKQALASDDVSAIQSASQTLQNATYALSQQMYAGNAADGGSTGRQPEPGEDVVEGDFTTI